MSGGTTWRTAIFLAVGMPIAFCSGCGSPESAPSNTPGAHVSPSQSAVTPGPTPAAQPVCHVGTRGTPDIADVFTAQVPDHFLVKEICASEVGPGLGGADGVAGLSDLAAA